jgi:hypothetical protein
MASASVARVSVTFANWPGQSRPSLFAKVPLSRIVPVVASTTLSTNVTAPVTGRVSPAGMALTVSSPSAM